MRLTFKYRLLPTTRLRHAMNMQLELCRAVYNRTLETRKEAYEQRGVTLNYYSTAKMLPVWKAEWPELTQIHSQVLQNVQVRVDLAFQGFFRRVHAGEAPGYPRFRGQGWYDSFTYPQYGNGAHLDGDRLHLSKIGAVRIKVHRPVQGTIKTVTLQCDRFGNWYACFSSEIEVQPLCRQATGWRALT